MSREILEACNTIGYSPYPKQGLVLFLEESTESLYIY
jgi:hypothetical protein